MPAPIQSPNLPSDPIQPAQIRRKLVVVGDGGSGKTSVLVAYTKKSFLEKYVPTVFENHVARVTVDGRIIDLALWDTAGTNTIYLLLMILILLGDRMNF
jgi:GTPase SAR1 family protein